MPWATTTGRPRWPQDSTGSAAQRAAFAGTSAAAGPAAGFAYAFLASFLWRETGQDWLSLSAGLSLLLSIFNLLPAPPLDGGRILAPLLCALLGSKKEKRIGRILGFGVGFILCALGIVSALKGKGAAPLLPGLWLLLREDL